MLRFRCRFPGLVLVGGALLLLGLLLAPVPGCRGGDPAAPVAPLPAGLESYLVDDFQSDDGELRATWRLEPFDGVAPSTYELAGDAEQRWLVGSSAGGAALLTHPLNLDPRALPRLRWRWRAERLPAGADLRLEEGDDAAARVFVTFAYEPEKASLGERVARSLAGRELPGTALCYVWDASLPVGTSLPNPYAEHTRVLVVRSGPAEPEGWRIEERDLLRDYRAAFDADPPRLTGLAVMVDADQTGGHARAAFDDFLLLAPDGD